MTLQPADIGLPTGNGKKRSCSQAQLGQATGLAVASFLSISCGPSYVRRMYVCLNETSFSFSPFVSSIITISEEEEEEAFVSGLCVPPSILFLLLLNAAKIIRLFGHN